MSGDGADSSTSEGLGRSALALIQPALQEVVDAGVLSGAVTLIWRDGAISDVTCVGWRSIEVRAPMQRDTIFRVASMTKPVTSLAALMLLEEGRLRLQDPIAKWAPEFAEMQVLRDPAGPIDDVYPAPREITIEDLMTHRAGLAYAFTSNGPIAHAYQQTLGDALDSDREPDLWMEALGQLPLSYPPGERFHYSHATDVLGIIIGRIVHAPFRDFLLERVLEPLGMADTDFYVPQHKLHRAAVLYRFDADTGGPTPCPVAPQDGPPSFTGGGAGLVSTADDYLQFARMLLGKGEVDGVRLLESETVALMTSNRLTEAQRKLPFLGSPSWGGRGFGLGVSVIVDPDDAATKTVGAKGAYGWPGVHGTWWSADPANKMVLIYLVQNGRALEPGSSAQANPLRIAAQAGLPKFQAIAYDALKS